MLRPVSDRATFVALRRAPAGRCGPVRVKVAPVSQPGRPGPGDAPRVAFALPRRLGGAVVRNRIRRRLRAALADLARINAAGADPVLPGGRAYLLSADAEAASCPYPVLRSWVEEAVRRASQPPGKARNQSGNDGRP